MKFFITDVFGSKRYSGNQLATFLDYGLLSSQEMQQIAKEVNFSETTFITSAKPGINGFPVRIFTPESEIEFAGHPTLGTAFIIQKYIQRPGVDKVKLDLAVGPISVAHRDELFWMEQTQPTFGEKIPPSVISKVIGVDESELNKDFPALETTTGLPFTIVPLKSMEAIRKAHINLQEYTRFISKTWAKGILIFSPEAYEPGQHLSVRVFVNYLGIPEDPATGSAAGCLAAYLLKTGFWGSEDLDLIIGQGYEIGRPSFIKMSARKIKTEFEISIGGKVIEIASGNWNVNE